MSLASKQRKIERQSTPTDNTLSDDFKYDDKSSTELMELMVGEQSETERLLIMKALRGAVRREEDQLRDKIKKEKDENRSLKNQLKETHNNMISSRKNYLEAYRIMNKGISGTSLVKNFNSFAENVAIFKYLSFEFINCLDSHVAKIADIKKVEVPSFTNEQIEDIIYCEEDAEEPVEEENKEVQNEE